MYIRNVMFRMRLFVEIGACASTITELEAVYTDASLSKYYYLKYFISFLSFSEIELAKRIQLISIWFLLINWIHNIRWV